MLSPLFMSIHLVPIGALPVIRLHSSMVAYSYTPISSKYLSSSARAFMTRSGINGSLVTSSNASMSPWFSCSSSAPNWFISASDMTSSMTRFRESILFCDATPSHTARQRARGYTCAWLALPHTSCTCRCFSSSGMCLLQHRLSNLLPTSGELVIMDVGFLTSPTPSSSFELIPNAHMSSFTICTPSMRATFSTSGMNHDVAVIGCSNRKYRPSRTCVAQSFITHRTWSFALSSSRRTTTGSRRSSFRAWSLENAVHIGEQTSM